MMVLLKVSNLDLYLAALVFPPETEKGMVIFLQKGHFQHAAFHKEGKGILKHLQYTVKFRY